MFGSIGYFFCSMQWVWAFLLYFSLIKLFALSMVPENKSESLPIQPAIPRPDVMVAGNAGPDIFFIIFAGLITVVVISITIYVIIKMPSTIAKASNNIVSSAAENVTPIILQIQHKKDTKKNHLKLTPLLILMMKIILIIAPIGLIIASQLVPDKFISFDIAMCVGLWLFCVSFIAFLIQYSLAKLFLLKLCDIR